MNSASLKNLHPEKNFVTSKHPNKQEILICKQEGCVQGHDRKVEVEYFYKKDNPAACVSVIFSSK